MTSDDPPPELAEDTGDFVESDDEGEIEETCEPRSRYFRDPDTFSSWYCPIRIGEVLHKQYRIEHKLGWGGFSTVWLARDLHTNLLVCLKILSISQHSHMEQRIHFEITKSLNSFDHARNVDPPARFTYKVLVLPVRGPSLNTVCLKVEPDIRIPASRHLLMAVKCLHDAGIIHRGYTDINSGAAMWDIERITHWSTSEVYKRIRRPRKVPLCDDENRYIGDLVEDWDATWNFPSDLLRPSLSLGDFSHAVLASEVKKSVQWPLTFCAPERYHGQETTFASDMWGFMLLFVQLYSSVCLSYGGGSDLVSRVVGALGPFPEEWEGNCTLINSHDWWYDQTGQFPHTDHGSPYTTLEEKLAYRRPDATPEELEIASKVIRKGLRYKPEERITAAQLLEDPSFKALLAYYER
ncbi:kinase domain-containing protein [Xylaria sp. FL1777]|nr:kinase domain-containing protein [Xylaria sp. FL1777]